MIVLQRQDVMKKSPAKAEPQIKTHTSKALFKKLAEHGASQRKATKVEPQIKKNHTLPSLASQRAAWAKACASVNWSKSDWTRRALAAALDGRLEVRFKEPKIVQGRAKGHEGPDEIVAHWQFRATDDDVARWKAEASAQGLTQTEWCRQVLDAAAKKSSQTFLLG